MPNHVYSIISVEEKYVDKLEEISKVGLCRYYMPMPLELEKSSSPTRIITAAQHKKGERGITKVMQRRYKKEYGYDNWYDWSHYHWGTKWGCYEGEHDAGVYRYTTAWGPVSHKILNMLLKDIPSFRLSWEEEQGYGAEIDYVDGEVSSYIDWDTPPWVWNIPKNTNDDIVYLEHDYTNGEGTFNKGFYAYYSLHEYLGETLEEAVANLG